MRPPSSPPQSFGPVSSPASSRRWKVALLTLAAVVAFIDLWSLSTWPRSLDPHVRGTLLASFEATVQAGGWQKIVKLDAGSPLQVAGAAVGDVVRFRRRGEAWLRRFGTDERIAVELRANGVVRELVLQPVADLKYVPAVAVPGYISSSLSRLVSLLIGALLALRRPESPAIRGLAVALILGSVGWYRLPSGELREQGVVWLIPLLEDIAGMGSLWFAFQVQEERPIWRSRSVMSIIGVLFTLVVAGLPRWSLQWRLGYDAEIWTSIPAFAWLTGSQAYTMAWNVINATTVIVLWSSWHRARGAMRVRIVWIAVALGAPLLWGTIDGLVLYILSSAEYIYTSTWVSFVQNYVELGSALILGWAVLRHRVFDFGFVIQRALAYSVVSTIILIVLGFGKWLTETLLQGANQERSFIHDAAIALAVVVTFAVLQQRITKYVTRVFFSTWHTRSESLREFLDQAAHLTDAGSIKQQFVAAVDAFTEGQGSAIYTADEGGNLNRGISTLSDAPPTVHSGDELALKLRESARRVDLSRLERRLPGDWAFPMTVRGAIYGVLLIGPRTEGVSYRPEELTQLAEGARTIGLNLESLRAVELQRKQHELAQRLDELTDANRSLAAENASLKGAVP